MRFRLAAAAVAVCAVVVAPVASAKIAVTDVTPDAGRAGTFATVFTTAPKMPIALVPWDRQPRPVSCGKGSCWQRVARPPRLAQYVWLGSTDAAGALRFRIPRLRPWVYAFVIFCDACVPGSRGALVAQGDVPLAQLLEIRP
jgi:hypothetical protein